MPTSSRGLISHPFRACALAGLLWACAMPATGAEPVPIDPPAAPGSTSPALTAEKPTVSSRDHDVLMTWLEPGGKLKFSRFSGETWTPPVTITEPVSLLDAADPPSLTVLDTQAVRRTLIARAGDVVARSGDAGRTWARLPAPPTPFASFAGGDEGGYAFWRTEEGLVGTRILAGATLLDASAAAGSATSATMTWDGPVVVYRADAHGVGGASGIALVRREDARWTPPAIIHAESWRPAGAQPAGSGPRVATLERHVTVAWYTEAGGVPRVLVAFSTDAGRSFAPPVEVDAAAGERAPAGGVDVAVDDGGQALVLWTAESGSGESRLLLSRVAPDGTRGREVVLARGPAGQLTGQPQMTHAGTRLAVAWSEAEPAGVRAVAVPLADVPPAAGQESVPAVAAEPAAPRYAGRGRVGESVPEQEVASLEGEPVSLTGLAGRPVLLNLWATWCLPCLAEMPELAELHERYGPDGLMVVGLSVDEADKVGEVRRFVDERRIPFAVWLDPEMAIHRALRVRSLPATFLIDRQGRIVWRRNAVIEADDPELGRLLRRVLGQP
jgi:cytochrome c biogenesis protein CcmG, thiol:disulfide interchange protein DsbE